MKPLFRPGGVRDLDEIREEQRVRTRWLLKLGFLVIGALCILLLLVL
ncbi:MAG: hypothetical protein ACT4O1_17100 [Gemmatimonadota bacterium]